MLIVGANIQKINKLKKNLYKEFDMKDLWVVKQISGMSITKDKVDGTLTLSQEKYIKKILEKFNMADVKPISTHFGQSSKTLKEIIPKGRRRKGINGLHTHQQLVA